MERTEERGTKSEKEDRRKGKEVRDRKREDRMATRMLQLQCNEVTSWEIHKVGLSFHCR